jgi:hypothetical protein
MATTLPAVTPELASAWSLLCASGLPDGPLRPAPRSLAEAQLASAVQLVGRSLSQVPEHRRDALLAWLAAFHHHWRVSFDRMLGADGELLLLELRIGCSDANRFIKLRRIAIENLSGVL